MDVQKSQIYYTRTYRRLRSGGWQGVLFVCLLVIPSEIVLFWGLPELTRWMSWLAVKLLCARFRGLQIQITTSEFPIAGSVSFVDLPTVYPNLSTIIGNLLVATVILVFICTGRRQGKPVAVFTAIMMVTHYVNCVFFLFAKNFFPYTAFHYSNLYVTQQASVWTFFILLAGGTIGFMGRRGALYKILAFLAIIFYSMAFGVVRYVFFLYILERFSIFYMALLFFVFGPFFDFVYLVWIYALYISRMGRLYDSAEERGEWTWS